MSKKKVGQKPGSQKQKHVERQQALADAGRRKFLWLGAGTLAAAGLGAGGAYRAGWFGSSPSQPSSQASQNGQSSQPGQMTVADHQAALNAANEMLERHARALGNAS